MKPFPHHYKVSQSWEGGREGSLNAPPRPRLAGGPPPEFDGKADRWSPEHLLLASVDLCLMTTFTAMAERKKLDVLYYSSETSGTLDRTREGLAFTEIIQKVTLKAAPRELERARTLLETAKKYCLIGNSLKPKVRLEAQVISYDRERVKPVN